jgi:predicted dehydrogenase
MKLVLVGLGYWGPNLLRTFNNLGAMYAAVDLDADRLKKFQSDPVYSNVIFDTDWFHFLSDKSIDGFVIATPPHTHYKIAMGAILHDKHLFIEKPMTLDVEEAETIVKSAALKNLVVMVGHIFLYSPEIIKLKEIISSENFGDVQYIYTQRLNLGKVQRPANVIDDLAPHDISILDYLLDKQCTEVQVTAKSHVIDTEDVAFINLKYNGTLCHLHLSWLDPLKVRNTVVVGTKQMAVCDSMSKSIHIHNTGIDVKRVESEMSESYSNYLMTYRYGDTLIPHIESGEPMVAECKEFLSCIKHNQKPLASADLGLGVVKTLNAIQDSLKGGGLWVEV